MMLDSIKIKNFKAVRDAGHASGPRDFIIFWSG